MKHGPNHRFESVPEPNRVQDGIHEAGEHTVMTVFGVGVVLSMVTRRLKQPDALQECDNRSIFHRRPMCPLVNLVGIYAQSYE